MRLARDLLKQAHLLAGLDNNRPKQANLRRAVSSTYYALFHLLIADAVHVLSPDKQALALMDRMSRAFQHGEMKQVCRQFQQQPLPDALQGLLPNASVSTKLKAVTQAFLYLQEERHTADYDVSARFVREEVFAIVVMAERAFESWARVSATERSVFLAALAFGARWSK